MADYKLVILESAFQEIVQSKEYYQLQSVGLGLIFEHAAFQVLERIRNKPLLFPIKFDSVREAPIARFPFLVCYELYDNNILILAVFHTSQHPSKKRRQA